MKFLLLFVILVITTTDIFAQTKRDSVAIRKAALDYIESQYNPDPKKMRNALHPLLAKRTFWYNKTSDKEYISSTSAERMEIVAETYNKEGDRFPKNPKKEVQILDIFQNTASVKLIAQDWIDYMHIVKLNGKWKIINVLWQYNDKDKHGRE